MSDTHTTSARAEIEANNDRFCAALGAHDAETLMALYDPEVTLLIPAAPPLRGHDAVRAHYNNVFAAGVTGAQMHTLDLQPAGATLVEIGTSTMTVAPEGAEAIEDTG